MQKNQKHAVEQIVAIKPFIKKYHKPIVITSSVIVLQLLFGFDAKFFIINLIWLLF
jgi:hypothetical protein